MWGISYSIETEIWSINGLAGIAALLPGGLLVIYQYVMITGDPALALWNAQNLTPAHGVLDLLASLSPALLLALIGVYDCWKTNNDRSAVLVFWLLSGIILIYLPFNLQRRFMTGLYVPVVGLAILGIASLSRSIKNSRWVWPLTVILSVGTNLLLLAGGLGAAMRQDPLLYLSRDEANVLGWMRAHLPPKAVVLASPEMGTFIPAWSGQSVVYGHPFESLHAAQTRQEVEQYFSKQLDTGQVEQLIAANQVGYVFLGARERALGTDKPATNLEPLFQSGEVSLYELQP